MVQQRSLRGDEGARKVRNVLEWTTRA